MKKFSLILGALGGAVAGYVFSNARLREQLVKAESAEEIASILGKHLQKDGKKVGDQVKQLVHSKEVRKNMQKAKIFIQRQLDGAKKETKRQACRIIKQAKEGTRTAVNETRKKVAKKRREHRMM